MFSNKVRARLGIPANTATYIDGGCYANVYDLHNGKVFKQTVDSSDAKAAKYISECSSDFIVKIHDVFRIDPEDYGIIADKAFPLTEAQEEAFDFIGNSCEHEGEPWRIAEIFRQQAKLSELKKYRNELSWLDLLSNELEDLGFQYDDFHSGNVMNNKKGNLILVDLGSSYGNWNGVKIPWV